MRTIWKAVLDIADTQTIKVPKGSWFMTAREQGDDICVWFTCDPEQPLEDVVIEMRGTGYWAPHGGRYLGSGIIHGGSLVFHVFVPHDA